MKHVAQYSEMGKLIAVGVGGEGVEITEEEYNCLLSEIRERAELINRMYTGKITIDDVPPDWREEIKHMVDKRIEAEGEAALQDISAEEALDIILGGEDV